MTKNITLSALVLTLSALTGCARMEDSDGDGWNDAVDNCPAVANVDQLDEDEDGIGDACVDDTSDDSEEESTSDDTTSPYGTSGVDEDEDGYDDDVDCNDFDASVNPGVVDLPVDDVDADCDASTDGWEATEYADLDKDGCTVMEGDSDDRNSAVYPDNGCHERQYSVDDGDCQKHDWYEDYDGDGYGNPRFFQPACERPRSGYVPNSIDDDDEDSSVGYSSSASDTSDDNSDNSGSDCQLYTWYEDYDGDRHGNPDISQDACFRPTGYVSTGDDCDDTDSSIWEDCDAADDDDSSDDSGSDTSDDSSDDSGSDDSGSDCQVYTWYEDDDGDRHGNPDISQDACFRPTGYVTTGDDCDDTDSSVWEDCDAADDSGSDTSDDSSDDSGSDDSGSDDTCEVKEFYILLNAGALKANSVKDITLYINGGEYDGVFWGQDMDHFLVANDDVFAYPDSWDFRSWTVRGCADDVFDINGFGHFTSLTYSSRSFVFNPYGEEKLAELEREMLPIPSPNFGLRDGAVNLDYYDWWNQSEFSDAVRSAPGYISPVEVGGHESSPSWWSSSDPGFQFVDTNGLVLGNAALRLHDLIEVVVTEGEVTSFNVEWVPQERRFDETTYWDWNGVLR